MLARSDVEVWLHHASLDELWPRLDALNIRSIDELRNLSPTEVLAIQRGLSSRPLAKLNQALLGLSETERTLGRLILSKKLTTLRRPAIPQRYAIRTSEAILTAAAQIEQLDHGHQEFHAFTADNGKVQFSPFRTKAIIRPNGPQGAISSILSISPSHRKAPTPAEARGNLTKRRPHKSNLDSHRQLSEMSSESLSVSGSKSSKPRRRQRRSKNQGHRRRRKRGSARKAAPVHIREELEEEEEEEEEDRDLWAQSNVTKQLGQLQERLRVMEVEDEARAQLDTRSRISQLEQQLIDIEEQQSRKAQEKSDKELAAPTAYESYLESRIRQMATELSRREAEDKRVEQGNGVNGPGSTGEQGEARYNAQARSQVGPRFVISPAQPSPDGDGSYGRRGDVKTPVGLAQHLRTEADLAAYLVREKELLRSELLAELGLSSQQVQRGGAEHTSTSTSPAAPAPAEVGAEARQ
jgi:hypothetical protein